MENLLYHFGLHLRQMFLGYYCKMQILLARLLPLPNTSPDFAWHFGQIINRHAGREVRQQP